MTIDNVRPQPKPFMRVQDEATKLREYWHVVLERRWLIIATFVAFVGLSILTAIKSTPIYEAVARLQIDPEGGGMLSLKEVVSLGNKDQEYLQTQYKNLQARSLIEAVITKLHLDEDDRYKKAVDRTKAVAGDIDIVPIRLTRLVEVRVQHPIPKRAAEIANTLMDIFLAQNQDRKSMKALQGFRLLKNESIAAELDLVNAQADVQDYRTKKKMISLVDDQRQMDNPVALGMRQARTDLEQQRIITADAERRASEAKRWRSDGNNIADFALIAQDRTVSEIKAKVLIDEGKLAALRTRYREKYPLVVQARKELEIDSAKLTVEAERAYRGIISAAELEAQKEEKANARYEAAEKEMQALYEAKTQFDVLNRKKERAETMYQLILSKTKEYDLNSHEPVANMVVIDSAVAPVKPVKPNIPLILAAGVFGGLGVALGLAFLINFLDDSIKSQEDVENFLRQPFLGYVPNIKSASVVERDLQAHLHPTSSSAEGFRTLRASVSLARNADKMRNLAVTSTIPSEGKSLVASNFAIVTAQTGLRTLLVDADLRRPSVHKAFELNSPVGLSAYLAERVHSVEEIIHSTEVPNLDIVCCGAVPSNPSELISSKRMLQFLEEVGTRYDRVIMDCPPVSAVADPLVVGAMCDGVLFVTKFNKIRREHALRSIQRILESGIHLVGCILNDIDFEGKDSYYYSYHYYQNRYYASHYRKGTADAVAKQRETAKKA